MTSLSESFAEEGMVKSGAVGALLPELKRTVMRDDYFDVNGFALRSCHSDGAARRHL